MKAEPISIPKPGTSKFEPEVRSGKVEIVGKGARRGWRVHLGGRSHQVLLPTGSPRSIFGAKLDVDAAPVAVPRGVGFRKTVSFVVGGHPATLELWVVFEPVKHWAGGGNVRRAGLLAFLGGLISAGAGAGLAVGAMNERRTRELARLSVDGEPAGTWISTLPARHDTQWEFVAAGEDLDSVATDWERTAEWTFRAGADVQATVDDAGLAQTLEKLVGDAKDRWITLEPVERRAMTVRLERETQGVGGAIVAKIPHGPAGRRSALTGIGWAVEADAFRGTRYFVRRYAAGDGRGVQAVIADLRSAYLALYGPRLRFEHWKLESGEAGTIEVNA